MNMPSSVNPKPFSKAEVAFEIQKFSQISNLRAAAVISWQWALILASAAAAIYWPVWYVWAAAGLVIATRQHALGILMHDAVHYRLFSNRFFNDLFGDLFCAFPIFLHVNGYRHEHLPHHQAPNTEKDPYFVLFRQEKIWQWPKPRAEALRIIFGDFIFLNLKSNASLLLRWSPFKHLFGRHQKPRLSAVELLSLLAFWATVLGAIHYFNLWLVLALLWVLPMLTLVMFFMRLRVISEHPYRPSAGDFADTNHVDALWIERVTLAPLNINFHVAHHLFPNIPFYNLPKAHEYLMSKPAYRDSARLYKSYLFSKDALVKSLIRS